MKANTATPFLNFTPVLKVAKGPVADADGLQNSWPLATSHIC